ncbi:MAG TPA: glycosyltransferase family 1 protein, partial [Elusimicrobiota bacterium]|nr:glycosyltransferase family 1 protein [Elusimicrobiota bacterium]
MAKWKVGILSTHPIQYYAPWYRALAERPEIDLTVFYAHRQTADEQARAGFGVAFDWDVPLLEGYRSEFLPNNSLQPDVSRFWGCDTPLIAKRIEQEHFDAFVVHGWNTLSFWQAIRACWSAETPVFVRGDSQLPT